MRLKTVILALFLASFVSVGVGWGNDGRSYLEVNEVTMSLEDGDAVFEVEFDLDPLARFYVLALGSKYIEPNLARLFVGFNNTTMVEADSTRAVLVADGAANFVENRYYLFDSRRLGSRVPKLIVVYPEGDSRTLYNVSSTPSVFFEA
jgi:hypothetical protein